MTMRTKLSVVLASICLAGAASGQQVEYVTRGHTGGHAIRFGSTPLKAELPRAYIRVNNAPHTSTTAIARARTVYGSSKTTGNDRSNNRHTGNRIGLKVRFVKIHGSDHVIPTFAVDRDSGHSRVGDRGRDRAQPTDRRREERPASSRHALMVHSLMKNKLDCHR